MVQRLMTLNWDSPLIISILAALFALTGGLIVAFGGPLVAAALIIAVFGALIVLRDMEIGLWATILVVCLIPFATIPIDIGFTPTFLDAAVGAFVGVWALRLMTGRQRTIITSVITLPILIFLIVAIFAFTLGMSNGIVNGTLLRKFAELLLSIGLVLVIVDYCRTWTQIERIMRVALLGGAAAAFIAIVLWLLPDETASAILNLLVRFEYPSGMVIRYIEENPNLSERAIGTSIDPNALGGLLTLFGALAMPQIVAEKPLFKRWITILITGLIYVAILLTFSRGAFLALGMAVVYVALIRHRKLIPIGIAAVLLLFLLPFTQGYVIRLVQGLTFFDTAGTDLASQMRLGEFRDAWKLIARYPVFGVGFSGSPDIDLYLGVANVYLSIAQQMGLVGLSAFFVIISTVFGYAFVNRHPFKLDSSKDAIWLGVHAAVVGGLTAGLFDHYLFNTEFHHTVTVFWLLLGLAVATTRLAES